MLIQEWEPLYERILVEMGYNRHDDEECASILVRSVPKERLINLEVLKKLLSKEVTIFGAGPSLESILHHRSFKGTLVAAGSAIEQLMEAGILPSILVTDLDGDIGYQLEVSALGAITVIHAHGDNKHLIERYASEFSGPVVLSTQSIPKSPLINLGGFTDGDRAACLAAHFGASIDLVAFEYDSPREMNSIEREVKLKKLTWAKYIIDLLKEDGAVIIHKT